MKPVYEKLDLSMESSFRYHVAVHPYFHTPLHYHPEFEIIYIEKSSGIRIVGDSIESFGDGDLAMLGPSIQHVWQNSPEYYESIPGKKACAHVIHFKADFWLDHFARLPENKTILELFHDSERGIVFEGKEKEVLVKSFIRIRKSKSGNSILNFIGFLNEMSQYKKKRLLSSPAYPGLRIPDQRFEKVVSYIVNHFRTELPEARLAEMCNMTVTSFSRFFRANTNKSFSRFVNEVRISNACKLLAETDDKIVKVCMDSGFNNLSNFNEQFRKLRGKTPSAYRSGIKG